MKKKILALLMAALMLITLFAGCGAASDHNTSADAAAPQEMYEMEEPAAGEIYGAVTNSSAAADQSVSGEQKLIKRVNMDVETEDLDGLLPTLSEKIEDLGGYIESQELHNGSAYSSYRRRSANMTIRIPADKLGSFVEDVRGASNVVTYNESTENVTLTYVSTESRMKALQVEEERLLELLAKAENMTDLLEIESRLTDVRYELENVTSQLRVLSNQVDYATVNLYIDQVKVYTEVEPQTVWQRIGSGFSENLTDIGEDLVDFFVWLVTYSPQLIVLSLIVAAVILVIRRRTKKRKVNKSPTDKPGNEEK